MSETPATHVLEQEPTSSPIDNTQELDVPDTSREGGMYRYALEVQARKKQELWEQGGLQGKEAVQEATAFVQEMDVIDKYVTDETLKHDGKVGFLADKIAQIKAAERALAEHRAAAEIARLEARIAELEAQTQRERADIAEGQAQESALRADEAEKKSKENEVTHLPNLLALKRELPGILASAHRLHQPVSLLYIDVDGLSIVNGAHGHDAGDELLKSFGNIAREVIREGDRLYHPHGDEFSIVLPYANPEEAQVIASRVIAAARERLLPALQSHGYMNDRTGEFSATIGISSTQDGDNDPDTLIKNADTAMFNAKQLGKESGEKGKVLFYKPGMVNPKYERNNG